MKRILIFLALALLAGCGGQTATPASPVPYAGTWRMFYGAYGPDGRPTQLLYAVVEIDEVASSRGLQGGAGEYRFCRGEVYTRCDTTPAGRVEVGVTDRQSLAVFVYYNDNLLILGIDDDGQLDGSGAIEGGGGFYAEPQSQGNFYFSPVNNGLN